MAMISCSECGKDISSKAEACPACGNPIEKTDVIICVEGSYYQQGSGMVMFCPEIEVFWDGKRMGVVSPKEITTFNFDSGGVLTLRLVTKTLKKEFRKDFKIADGDAWYADADYDGMGRPRWRLGHQPPNRSSGSGTFVGMAFDMPG